MDLDDLRKHFGKIGCRAYSIAYDSLDDGTEHYDIRCRIPRDTPSSSGKMYVEYRVFTNFKTEQEAVQEMLKCLDRFADYSDHFIVGG